MLRVTERPVASVLLEFVTAYSDSQLGKVALAAGVEHLHGGGGGQGSVG